MEEEYTREKFRQAGIEGGDLVLVAAERIQIIQVSKRDSKVKGRQRGYQGLVTGTFTNASQKVRSEYFNVHPLVFEEEHPAISFAYRIHYKDVRDVEKIKDRRELLLISTEALRPNAVASLILK